MCLAIPGQVISLEAETIGVEFGGVKRRVGRALVPDVKQGDWVLVHAGFAIQIMSPAEAESQLALIREVFGELADEQTGESLGE